MSPASLFAPRSPTFSRSKLTTEAPASISTMVPLIRLYNFMTLTTFFFPSMFCHGQRCMSIFILAAYVYILDLQKELNYTVESLSGSCKKRCLTVLAGQIDIQPRET